MIFRPRLRCVLPSLACILLLALSGCGGDEGTDASGDGSDPSEVTGVVIDIEGETIDTISGFTLKDGDETYEILIADDVEYGFPLGHLHAHLAGADPVKVELEERKGELFALSIDDA